MCNCFAVAATTKDKNAHLSYQYGLNSHYAYCSITLAILIVPTVTLNVLSFGWHKQDGGTSSATIIAALIQLGMFHRHCQVLWLSIGKVSKNLEALHTMEKKTADLRLLHLYEVFLKSALQISFQIYLIYDTDAWNKFTVVSVSLSFLSLCWAVIEYDVATWRLKHKNKTELVCSMIIHELGRVIVVLSRIVAMAMMMIADDGNAPFIFIANYALTLVFVILMNKVEAILPSEGWMCWIHHITATAAFNFSFIDVGDSSFRTLRILVYANGMLQNGECVSEFFHERLNHGAQLHAYVGWGVLVSFAVGAGLIWLCLWKGEMLPGHCYLFPNKETTDSEVCPVPWTVASQPLGTEGQGLTHYCPLLHICNTHVRALPIARILMHRHLGATFVVSAVFKMAASMSSSSSANKGHTAISTSTFYSVLKERPKRFVHANLLDAIDPNESDFSADKKSDEKVSGDSSDEGDAIQTEVKEAEEEVATSTDAPSVDRTPRSMKRRYTWVKKDFDIEAGSFENNFPLPPAEPLSAVEYFDVFVSRSMLKAVVDESNKYYFQKHGTTLNLTVEKLTPVLGMFFRMGLVNMHRVRAHWENESRYELVAQVMSHNRFEKITSHLHFFDNEAANDKVKEDKCWKVRPWLSSLRSNMVVLPQEKKICSGRNLDPFLWAVLRSSVHA
ncbi:uncharacterized protein LOC119163114 isoform X4 [Rhipicephalus microplus]|uniref:uncharacterized protein LOC119163114 isoform X4 n=1 Tax=Rhipicephalus microplus TaxID=6941 RepID=UPI003F6C175A